MTPFDYEKNNILDYSDDSLRILKDKIEKELERREQEKETEAKKKVIKAIQDYLAAGYSIHVRGNVVFYADGYEHNSDFISEVFGIQDNDGEIILDVEECCLD